MTEHEKGLSRAKRRCSTVFINHGFKTILVQYIYDTFIYTYILIYIYYIYDSIHLIEMQCNPSLTICLGYSLLYFRPE